MTGPGTGKEGGERSDQAEQKERKDSKDGVDKSNTQERKESDKPKEKEPEKDREKDREKKDKDDEKSRDKEKQKEKKPEKSEQPKPPKGKAYDDANRVEREGKSPYELPPSPRPQTGGGGSYQIAESKQIDFPKGKDAKTQMEEDRKKRAEDAERTLQEQRRLMSRLR